MRKTTLTIILVFVVLSALLSYYINFDKRENIQLCTNTMKEM